MNDQGSSSVIVTLFEGDYHKGVGALVNSLYHHGFRGYVYAGYRGELPAWATPTTQGQGYTEYAVSEDCWIRFVEVQTLWHLTNFKAQFMLDMWANLASEAKAMFYFDPDIVIRCSWAFYEKWSSYGIGLVQEVVAQNMPVNHPLRFMWMEFLNSLGLTVKNNLSQYFNGGFVAVQTQYMEFVELWKHIMEGMNGEVDLSKFAPGDRTSPYHMTDQDGLNMASMVTSCPLSTIGPEAMDLIGGGFTMSHAVGSPKPWRKKFLRSALRGVSPSLADKGWIASAAHPIPVLLKSEQNRLLFCVRLSSAISRIISPRN